MAHPTVVLLKGVFAFDWQPLSVFSSVAVLCCPASRHAGFSRRKAPRPTPRQPWCCRVSYGHSHRQEHKQPTTQKQGTLFNQPVCLRLSSDGMVHSIYWRSCRFQPQGWLNSGWVHGGKTLRGSHSCMCEFTFLVIDLFIQQTLTVVMEQKRPSLNQWVCSSKNRYLWKKIK